MGTYVAFSGISKSFPGVKALDTVSFGVDEGSVHALLGENGAGKSTMLKILSGAHTQDAGHVIINGRPHRFNQAQEAFNAGVAVIYQELNLVQDLTVQENLLLGHMPTRGGLIDFGQLREQAMEALRRVGEAIDPGKHVRDLSIGQQQMVEIAKALIRDAKVIAFDEPTSSLSHKEVQLLFDAIRRLRDDGRAVIYVSHRLNEVFEVCDAVTVFRDGKLVVTHNSLNGIEHDYLVSSMVGRSINDIYNYRPRPHGATMLEVKNIVGPGVPQPASFSIKAGEIVGLFGLVGAGRTELMRLVFGAERKSQGNVFVEGKHTHIRRTQDAIRHGIALMPEDRKRHGIISVATVAENINLTVRPSFGSLGGQWVNRRKEELNAERFIQRLSIKTPSLEQIMDNLSGGNQQKTILARWLSINAKVFLMDEPTRGIDVGTKAEIYSIMHDLAKSGVAVIVVSSELPEVLGVCDRIIVMREGGIVASVPRDEASEESILRLALPAGDTVATSA